MKCPQCGVPILDDNPEVCPVCNYNFSSPEGQMSENVNKESTPKEFEKAMGSSENTDAENTEDLPFEAPPKGLHIIKPTEEFIGRKGDINRLQEELKRMQISDKLTFVTVHGIVGIGKSRLVKEFGDSVKKEGKIPVLYARHRGAGSVTFHIFIDALTDWFGIIRETADTDMVLEIIREKITPFVEEPKIIETAHLITQFLGFNLESSIIIEPLRDSPSQMELRMFIALRRFLAGLSEPEGLLIIFDETDRFEPESVNLLHYLAAGLSSNKVMILTSGRDSTFKRFPQWSSGEYATLRIKLPQLTPDEAEEMLRKLLPKVEKMPKSLIANVREHMDRSPRVIEELARYLLESEILDTDHDPWRIKLSKLSTTDIPSSLEGILKARIFVLPDGDRDILNRASVFGENFWQDGVVALIRRALYSEEMQENSDGPSLDDITRSGDFTVNLVVNGLERHAVRGFIEKVDHSSLPGEKQFRFKYPPIWNLVYDSMPESHKKLFHLQAAEWLELHLQDAPPELYEEVGRHLELAGSTIKAVQKYRAAAELSKQHYHNDKAIRLYIHALALNQLTDISERINLWHDLGNIYELKGAFNKALSCYEKMLRLSWVMSSRSKAGVAFNKMGRLYRQMGQLSLALEYLKRGLNLFEVANDIRGIASSKDDIGQVLYALGENDEAMGYCGEALELRRQLGDNRSIAVILNNIGYIEMDRGLFNEASSCFFESMSIFRKTDDNKGYCKAINSMGILQYHQGNYEEAIKEWMKGLSIAGNIGYEPMAAKYQNNIGEALYMLGRYPEAMQRLEQAIELAEEMNEKQVLFDAKRNMSLVLTRMGKVDDAMNYAEDALTIAKELDILEFKARASMTIGEVMSSTVFNTTEESNHQLEEAKIHFQQGIDLFRLLSYDREVAKGLKRYGQFLIEAGNEKEALEPLEEARKMFAKLGMKELEEVKNLLSALKE